MGHINKVEDIIYVKSSTFDNSKTNEIASEIEQINNQLKKEGRNYVLVGPGRWGSSDPWLGIPIKWPHISEAKVIVECGLENFRIEPSQGTHFFQNLTSFGVGYLTINPFMNDGLFKESELDLMDAIHDSKYLRHIRFSQQLYIYVDGKKNKGIIKTNKEQDKK
jgi:hypothetical protein